MNPELMAHFCVDAPIFLTSNTNPIRGLANGVKATLYALDWPTDATRTAALEFLSTHATGDVVLPDHLRPTEILVRPSLSDALKAQWSPDMTLVEGDSL